MFQTKRNILYYSKQDEPIPKVFLKYSEKQTEKRLHKLQQLQNTSSPAKSQKRIFFSTPNSNKTIARALFSTPKVSPFPFESNVQQLDCEQIVYNLEDGINQLQVDAVSNNQYEIQEEHIFENIKEQSQPQLTLLFDQSICELEEILLNIQKNQKVHTKQYFQLLQQCYELLCSIKLSNDKEHINKKILILDHLISQFAQVLPELESQVITIQVNKIIKLGQMKIDQL